jgi:MOSC domain-containing protein YiiM
VRVEFLGLADGDGFETRQVQALTLTYDGIPGDRHAGATARAGVRQKHLKKGTELRNARQLSLLSVEELALISQSLGLPTVAPQWLGANVVVSGRAGFTQLAPSTRLVFASGAVLAVDGDNDPCTQAGGAVERGSGVAGLKARFVKAATDRRGLVAWVEVPGLIRQGDEVTVVAR